MRGLGWWMLCLVTPVVLACGYPADWDEAKLLCHPFQERKGARTEFYEYNRVIDDATTPTLQTQPWPSGFAIKQAEFSRFERKIARIADVSALLLSHNQSLLVEKYYNGIQAKHSQNVHSLSKSILSMVVGVMLKRGELSSIDVPLRTVLPDTYQSLLTGDKAKLTVGDLLKMLSGLTWEEDVTEYRIDGQSRDWIAAILSLSMTSPHADRRFNYSTGNTHVMSSVVEKLTGANLCEYTHRHLLLPLGIKAEHWGVDPKGYLSGGFEVNLTAREIAVLGHLLVNNDPNKGYRRFFAQTWLSQATTVQARYNNERGYGYLWWVVEGTVTPIYFAYGYGGQFLFVVPSAGVSLVITTNTSRDQNSEEPILTATLEALKQWFP